MLSSDSLFTPAGARAWIVRKLSAGAGRPDDPITHRKRNSHVISRRTDALVERTGSPADTMPARDERLDVGAPSAADDHGFAARVSRVRQLRAGRRRAVPRASAAPAHRDRDQADLARTGALHPGARRSGSPHARRDPRQPSPGARRRREAVHDLQVPHDAGGRRGAQRRGLGHPERPPGHPGGALPAPVPAGRDPPAAQRDAGRDEHRGAPARAAHDLRRAAGAHQGVPAAPAGQAGDHRAWPRSTTTTIARWTTCAPRCASTSNTSGVRAFGRICGSCSAPSR